MFRPLLPHHGIAAGFSLVANLLLLVSPLYMLQVYDRVLVSGSRATLILLSGLALGLLVAYGFAEAGRRRAMAMAGVDLGQALGPRLLRMDLMETDASGRARKDFGDLGTLQTFHAQGLVLPLHDLPFTPMFLAAMFLIHPWIGWLGVAGALVLLALATLSDLTSRATVRAATEAELTSQAFVQTAARQQAAIQGLGMGAGVETLWRRFAGRAAHLSLGATQASGALAASARALRNLLQVMALGLGAWLVLAQQTTPGAIVAGSILLGRALAPIDQSVGAWRALVKVCQAAQSLRARFSEADASPEAMTPLPRPAPVLKLDSLGIAPPGRPSPLVPKFSLTLTGGTVVALVGPSGAGKSTLLTTLAGVWRPHDGTVSLGGRDMHLWPADDRGRHVGYAPDTADLLPVTVGQNIARLARVECGEVYRQAHALGLHETLLGLPLGYDTPVGPGGAMLSAGQQQGVSLARAFLGDPVLLLLDEPSTHLDEVRVTALCREIAAARARDAIVILATHDPRLIDVADQVVLFDPPSLQRLSAKAFRERRGSKVPVSIPASELG